MTDHARITRTERHVSAYCRGCDRTWDDKAAQGSAALHHDITGHTTVAAGAGRASAAATPAPVAPLTSTLAVDLAYAHA
jgi:hypothetical protein